MKQVKVVCDICGHEAGIGSRDADGELWYASIGYRLYTPSTGLTGGKYDLCPKHAKKLEKVLKTLFHVDKVEDVGDSKNQISLIE